MHFEVVLCELIRHLQHKVVSQGCLMLHVKHNIPHRWSDIWQGLQELLEALWIYHLLPFGTVMALGFWAIGHL